MLGARAGLPRSPSSCRPPPRAPSWPSCCCTAPTVVPVDGTYDQAFDLSLAAIAENGWYSRNCAHNPLLVEGKKTAGLELASHLTAGFTRADETLPDVVFVSVGDGCIVSATGKAFAELEALGLIGKVPRVIGVQAAGASPLASRLGRARRIRPAWSTARPSWRRSHRRRSRTIADSISVGVPRNRVKAWRRVAASGGAFISVEDDAITAGRRLDGAPCRRLRRTIGGRRRWPACPSPWKAV